MPRQLFVNLPIQDMGRSKAFFALALAHERELSMARARHPA